MLRILTILGLLACAGPAQAAPSHLGKTPKNKAVSKLPPLKQTLGGLAEPGQNTLLPVVASPNPGQTAVLQKGHHGAVVSNVEVSARQKTAVVGSQGSRAWIKQPAVPPSAESDTQNVKPVTVAAASNGKAPKKGTGESLNQTRGSLLELAGMVDHAAGSQQGPDSHLSTFFDISAAQAYREIGVSVVDVSGSPGENYRLQGQFRLFEHGFGGSGREELAEEGFEIMTAGRGDAEVGRLFRVVHPEGWYARMNEARPEAFVETMKLLDAALANEELLERAGPEGIADLEPEALVDRLFEASGRPRRNRDEIIAAVRARPGVARGLIRDASKRYADARLLSRTSARVRFISKRLFPKFHREYENVWEIKENERALGKHSHHEDGPHKITLNERNFDSKAAETRSVDLIGLNNYKVSQRVLGLIAGLHEHAHALFLELNPRGSYSGGYDAAFHMLTEGFAVWYEIESVDRLIAHRLEFGLSDRDVADLRRWRRWREDYLDVANDHYSRGYYSIFSVIAERAGEDGVLRFVQNLDVARINNMDSAELEYWFALDSWELIQAFFTVNENVSLWERFLEIFRYVRGVAPRPSGESVDVLNRVAGSALELFFEVFVEGRELEDLALTSETFSMAERVAGLSRRIAAYWAEEVKNELERATQWDRGTVASRVAGLMEHVRAVMALDVGADGRLDMRRSLEHALERAERLRDSLAPLLDISDGQIEVEAAYGRAYRGAEPSENYARRIWELVEFLDREVEDFNPAEARVLRVESAVIGALEPIAPGLNGRRWPYHVVLEYRGRIYDFSLGNEGRPADEYFTSLLGHEGVLLTEISGDRFLDEFIPGGEINSWLRINPGQFDQYGTRELRRRVRRGRRIAPES